MWSIRILKGHEAGKIFELQEGDNIIGRAPDCTIRIPTPGISKQHAKIIVQNNKIFIQDLQSTNGTFVNGIRINYAEIKSGDKIAVFDCMFALISAQQAVSTTQFQSVGNAALNMSVVTVPQTTVNEQTRAQTQHTQIKKPQTFLEYLEQYMHNILLPGVYKIGELFEFKWALGSFVAIFIVMVTILSVIPMIQITKSSIQQESMRRAESLAMALKDRYVEATKAGTENIFDTRFIEREDGVEVAIVVSSATGKILAPARRAGESLNKPFIHQARKSDESVKEMIDDGLIGVSIPISSYSKDSGDQVVVAHSIIIYDLGSRAIDANRTLSLFIQVFSIALVLGFIVYFFMINFIEYPISALNRQLNKVLKNELDTVDTRYQFPLLQTLVGHLNTLIHRSKNPVNSEQHLSLIDHNSEALEFLNVFPIPALAVDKSKNMIGGNSMFEEVLGLHGAQLSGQPLSSLSDQALVLSLNDLLDRSRTTTQDLVNKLEFSSQTYDIHLKIFHGDHEVKYYVFILISQNGGFHVG